MIWYVLIKNKIKGWQIEREALEYLPKYEYLTGSLKGKISRKTDKQHRLVYEVFEEEKTIKVCRIWAYYD